MSYYFTSAGSWNKSHGTVERTPRIDSFDLALTEIWGYLWWQSTRIPIYQEWDSCTLLPERKGEQEIALSHKPNGYGKSQTFFMCPACGARVRFLYFTGKDRLFKCRKCSRLNYRSQQRTRDSMDGYIEGMRLAEEKLSVPYRPDGFSFPSFIPSRPRYMHENTYNRILKRFCKHQERYTARMLEDLKRLLHGFK